jgi:hypothetical protein
MTIFQDLLIAIYHESYGIISTRRRSRVGHTGVAGPQVALEIHLRTPLATRNVAHSELGDDNSEPPGSPWSDLSMHYGLH